ncbi:beta-L-arabinofuranosidase domain-containing protein [Fimbriimonas ginsengisoli]|uniref:Transcriptional initiation protein Tat n=1 Tax=Fimbriimonas ginsengisoli Gsoil 348 TaxID=661478 RepID=A0A068NNV4_FIMGI|nr:beta-L-arabinofuranosidase domain-containing protein [Fimbriimonas ginsengisoli]AIE85111.1 hypothetical protein OP10G_1743 [Fimbriimonas ginsengisoli Gsoil 348]
MLPFLIAIMASSSDLSVRVVDRPDLGPNRYYIGNRPPLTPSAFRKLPIGAIKPKGWVKKQLQLQADGFIGHLTEISGFLDKKDNAWLTPNGEGKNGWEEVPYWLKGFGDLGYVLDDPRIQKEAKIWIDGVIAGQREDGYFGPRANLKSNDGKPDVWPNMVMLNALQSYHERTGDPRVINLMRRYFRWQLNQPDNAFLLSYWEKHRGGDNMASVFWLYNRTGDEWLLDLAHKLHRRNADWTAGMPDGHGVNFAQAFREPATYAALTHNPVHLTATERDYEIMRDSYGQVPGGMYGADENVRPGKVDPRQAAETCAMVEMMLSDELLLAQTGDPVWAERCEDVTFNSLPASMTADLKALHYLTSPNMPLIDQRSKAPGLQNSGPMQLFDPNDHRCCQHNVSHGWPYYAEHLWLATAGNGLGVALYAPSKVTAKVGDGTPVTIEEETTYPFEQTVRFTVRSPKAVRFPLTLRLPTWCDAPSLRLNGNAVRLPHLGAYAILEREWHDGDRLELRLPMHISVRKWSDNKDSISVDRGPLTYSLKIGEKYQRQGGTDAWPAFEVLPTTPWNYGLVEGADMKVVERPFPHDDQPFRADAAPIEIHVPARRIPQWNLDQRGLVDPLQPSPARTDQSVETVTLIPMGAARLRISSFPTVSPQGHPWETPVVPKPAYPAASSHTYEGDSTDALSDGVLPQSSGDLSIPRFTWWDHKGSTEWVEYHFPYARSLSQSEVYWFDDRPDGGCRIPASWRLLAWIDGAWQEVNHSGFYGVERDRFNSVSFNTVKTTKIRLEAKLQPDASSGILEWRVK